MEGVDGPWLTARTQQVFLVIANGVGEPPTVQIFFAQFMMNVRRSECDEQTQRCDRGE
jgi:hypothetical protein